MKRHSPKVKAAAVYIDKTGLLRAAGPLSALPFNPHPFNRCPVFRVSFNEKWVEVELEEASETYGWIAVATPMWNDSSVDSTPKVDIRKQ